MPISEVNGLSNSLRKELETVVDDKIFTLEAKVEEQQKKIDSLESRLLAIEAQLSPS